MTAAATSHLLNSTVNGKLHHQPDKHRMEWSSDKLSPNWTVHSVPERIPIGLPGLEKIPISQGLVTLLHIHRVLPTLQSASRAPISLHRTASVSVFCEYFAMFYDVLRVFQNVLWVFYHVLWVFHDVLLVVHDVSQCFTSVSWCFTTITMF